MKVLVLTNMWPTVDDSAFGTFVYEQVRELRCRGVAIDILFVNGRAAKINYFHGFPRLWNTLRQERYDLIHAHYVYSGLIARAQISCPVILSLHGEGEPTSFISRLAQKVAPWFDEVSVTSKEHYSFVGNNRAQIIPCGVDLDLFQLGDKCHARRHLGLPADGKLILYCGGFRPEKRVPLIEASVKQLRTSLPEATLVKAIGRPHREIPLWMQAADALVLISDYEGSPVVIKEAMAMNLPIVATAVGDIPERFGNLSGHYLVRQDMVQVANALERALEHGPTEGRQAILHLSLEKTTDQILALYASVI